MMDRLAAVHLINTFPYDYIATEHGELIKIHHTTNKEQPMNTTTLKAQIETTERELAKLKTQLEQAENPYGKDTFRNGSVLRFAMQYYRGSKTYEFAAIKAGSAWYPTGSLGTLGRWARSWEALCSDWRTYGVQPEDITVLSYDHTLGERQALL